MKKYLAILLAVLCGFFGSFGTAVATNEDKFGRWDTLPYTVPINPVHLQELPPNGENLLIVSGAQTDSNRAGAVVLDTTTGIFTQKYLPSNLFCNAATFFPDGRILFAGGTKHYNNPWEGEDATTIFDWRIGKTGKFVVGPKMADGRWYPTSTVLSNGKTVTYSGLGEGGFVNDTVEIFTPAPRPKIGKWGSSHKTPFVPGLYPRAHMVPPYGDVFYTEVEGFSRYFDSETLGWSSVAKPHKGRAYGTSVLLPLLPSSNPEMNYRARVLIAGGNSPATNTAEIIDLSSAKPEWKYVNSMHEARIQLYETILPNGKILVTGGSKINQDPKTASLSAELFNPLKGTWRTLASQKFARLYHSTTVLMPDATVWSFGSNPGGNVFEPRIEVFRPPYLYTRVNGKIVLAQRPVIMHLSKRISYGKKFFVNFRGEKITSMMLMRYDVATHAFKMEQRAIGLNFRLLDTYKGWLVATAPPSGIIAPPGYYMLFLVNDKGVPSVAKTVQLL